MKVIDMRIEKPHNCFINLKIGQVYKNIRGDISIKTANGKCNCITFKKNHWVVRCEEPEAFCIPIDASLILEKEG